MNEISKSMSGNRTALEKLQAALQQASETAKSKKGKDFLEAYEVIEEHLAMKVSMKLVLETFNSAYGHKLHAPGFRKLLEEERLRRSQEGDEVKCKHCSHVLAPAKMQNDKEGGADE